MYVPQEGPLKDVQRFLNTIWKRTEGAVYAATKSGPSTDDWSKYIFSWPEPENKFELSAWILEQEATGKEVYVGPAIYQPGTTEPTKENILGSWVYWAEWDGFAPDWDELDPSRPVPGPLKGIPEPTIRIQSSLAGHEHAYWLNEEFQTNVDVIERINKTIAYAGNADTGCWNVNRVLRPPHTSNYGYGKKDREKMPVKFVSVAKSFVTPNSFDTLPTPRTVIREELELGELPSLNTVLAKYEWTSELLNIFESNSPEKGDRSAGIVRIAMMCAELGFSEGAIYVVIEDVDKRWGKYVDRSDRTKLLAKIVERAKTKHPRATKEEVWREDVETSAKAVYGFNELLKADIEIDWIVKDLLPRGGIGIVAAAPGVGKTLFSVDFAINAALGRDYLQWNIDEEAKILYLSMEMSAAPFQYFLSSMAPSLTEEELERLNTRLLVAPVGESILLDDSGEEFLKHLLDMHKPDIVIVDSLSQMLLEMQDDKESRKFMSKIQSLNKAYNTSFIFIHHNRKPAENKPATQADMFGSVFIAASVDFILSLWIDTDHSDSIRFAQVKNRLAKRGDPQLMKRDEYLRYSLEGEYVQKKEEKKFTKDDLNGLL